MLTAVCRKGKKLKPDKFSTTLLPALVFALVGLTLISSIAAEAVPRVGKEKLKEMLGDSDIIILDVRNRKNWQESEFKIKGAIRKMPKFFDSWANEFPKDKMLVLYWAWPNEETSAGLAQKLLNKGYSKVYALGGGWDEWNKADYPVEEKSPLLL